MKDKDLDKLREEHGAIAAAITPDGRLSREEWKTAIKKIIAEERINLLNKI